jgi:hypothetical protein
MTLNQLLNSIKYNMEINLCSIHTLFGNTKENGKKKQMYISISTLQSLIRKMLTEQGLDLRNTGRICIHRLFS